MDEDAAFTMRLIDELSAPARAMKEATAAVEDALGDVGAVAEEAGAAFKSTTKDVDRATEAMRRLDAAMAHQSWVELKRGQASAGRLSAEFRKMDDAMSHQKWVGLKRAEVQSQKAAFAAKQHAEGLARVEAMGPGLGQLAMGPLKAIGIAAGVAVLAVGAAVAAVTVKIGGAIVEASSFAQKSKLALTQLTGSATTAAAEFDNVRHMAAALGLDVDSTQKSFQKLLASQFSIGQAKELIKMGADLQVVTGEAESAQRALLTLSQIKAKGKLQGEELMQLQEAGVSQGLILDALEQALGKDRAEVQKMLSGGKIDAETGVSAIIEAIKHKVGEKELGEAGAKFADSTMAGFTAKLKGGFRNAMVDIGVAVEPAIGRITTLMSGMLDRLIKSGKLEQLSSTLIAGFTKFTDFIEQNWPTIEAVITKTIDFIVKGVWFVIDALSFMAANWSTISMILKVVGVAIGVVVAGAVLMAAPFLIVVTAILAVAAAVAFAVGWLVTKLWPAIVAVGAIFAETFSGIIAPFKAAFAAIASIFDATGMSWTEKLFQIGVAIVTGLVNGITSLATAPVELVWNIGKKIIAAFEGALKIGSPSKVFRTDGITSMASYTIGVDDSADKAIEQVKSVATDISGAFSGALAMQAPANDVSPVAQALGADTSAPTLTGANVAAATTAVQAVQGAGGEGGPSAGPISVTVQVSGADVSNPEELGTTIGVAVRRELEAIFDKAS